MSAALLLGRPEIRKRSQMRKLQRKKKERLRRLQRKRAGSSCGACRLLSCARPGKESLGEITRFVADAYAKRFLQPPSWPGVDYMLSWENIVVVDAEKRVVAPFPPHVMFCGAYLTNAELGSERNPAGREIILD